MFAGHRCRKDVEFIQSHKPVDRTRTGNICRCTDVVHNAGSFVDGLCVIDRIPRPWIIEQLLTSDKSDVPAGVMGLFDKLTAFVFAGDNEDMVLHNREVGLEASVLESYRIAKFNFSKKNVT